MGSDKAWIDSGTGRPLLVELVDRVAQRIPPESIVIAARCDQALPNLPADVRIAFDMLDNQGPMAGIVAGLECVAGEVDAALVLAADSPGFDAKVIDMLLDHLAAHDAAVPKIGVQLYPLTALYRTSPAATAAREFFDRGGRRVIDWVRLLDAAFVDEETLRSVDPTLATFAPCNTPEDLRSALTTSRREC